MHVNTDDTLISAAEGILCPTVPIWNKHMDPYKNASVCC